MTSHKPKIIHHGAINGVTGSCHEYQVNENNRYLIDCGLFQGSETSKQGRSSNDLSIEFPIDSIQALIVTHVHIDHVGRIPHLVAAGFRGPIYCSEPSAILLPLVLEDAMKVGFTLDKTLLRNFLKLVKSRIRAVPYGQWQDLESDSDVKTQIKLNVAGHILGSSYVEIRSKAQHKNHNKESITPWYKAIFSGDLGAPYSPLLKAPKPPYSADVLVLESTYGDKCHESRRTRRLRLKAAIEHALRDKGTVLIPAFSIGRTQELLYELEQLIHQGKNNQNSCWKDLQVVIDSPLASRFTEAYKQLSEFWDIEARTKLAEGRHPLDFRGLITIDSHKDHLNAVRVLSNTEYPAVVIAASGMCAGGRIVNYLKAMIDNPVHDILFVGYQARGTLGREILDTKVNQFISVDGSQKVLRAQVDQIGGYSAHADQQNLVDFVRRMKVKPGLVRLVHGENKAKQALRRKLNEIGVRAVVAK